MVSRYRDFVVRREERSVLAESSGLHFYQALPSIGLEGEDVKTQTIALRGGNVFDPFREIPIPLFPQSLVLYFEREKLASKAE